LPGWNFPHREEGIAVGYGQRLRTQKSADARVLKAQLDLIADVVHAARMTAPLWALCAAWLASGDGLFGHMPLRVTLLLPAAIFAATFSASRIAGIYRADTAAHDDYERLRIWFARFVGMQVITSTLWGVMPWLLWDSGNVVNHVFMALAVVSVLAWFVVSRANHLEMFMASVVPLVALADLRFVTDFSLLGIGIAVVLTGYAAQLFFDGRRLNKHVDEDSRLRFEVEDLARELEEARDEALRKRFEAETANASKTAFLANMSHELRTPLNAILGFSEIIAKECFGQIGIPRYTDYASDIHASGTHLLSLINDLLDVAKIEAGRMDIRPEILDVRTTLDTALKLVGAKARERHQELVIDVEPNAPELFADERALKQILINLVSNAVKFTPEGGRIDVVAGPSLSGDFQIMVCDNGPGIPREKLDKIFMPFNQVDNRYDRQGGGTGLGLALVRGLAELHGGRAWIESEHGSGCRAYVVLPTKALAARQTSAKESAEAA
jgi:two-component system cell cycle sensor histidine kinase PleC